VDAIRTTWRMLLLDERGATAIEYGLIAALIVIAMAGALGALGGGVGGLWADLGTTVATQTGG
jgi:pilus assembly protein Flp/PilA